MFVYTKLLPGNVPVSRQPLLEHLLLIITELKRVGALCAMTVDGRLASLTPAGQQLLSSAEKKST